MKNVIAVVLLTAAAPMAHAQLEKGNIMVGGTGGFAAAGGNGGYFSINLQPRVGLFLTDRLVAGTGLGLGLTTYRFGTEGRITSLAGSVEPFARYYFVKPPAGGEVPKGLVPFGELGTGVGAFRFRGETYAGTNGYAMLGLNKFFNKHVALEVGLSYRRESYNGLAAPFRSGPFGGTIGLQFFMGQGRAKQAKGAEADR